MQKHIAWLVNGKGGSKSGAMLKGCNQLMLPQVRDLALRHGAAAAYHQQGGASYREYGSLAPRWRLPSHMSRQCSG